jgi:hypothetical protein
MVAVGGEMDAPGPGVAELAEMPAQVERHRAA